jgi:hypothetical protein
MPYCRRCDLEDVGYWHRCFVRTIPLIRPLKKRPEKDPNTRLARKLASMYEAYYEEPFPGGVTNATVRRDQLAINCYRDSGAIVWSLDSRSDQYMHNVRFWGSSSPATQCAKDANLIIEDVELNHPHLAP